MKRMFQTGSVAILAVGACAAFSTSLSGSLKDSLWMQQKIVPIGAANFEQCVTAAVADLNGVSINRAHSGYGGIALDVQFDKPIPFLDVQVWPRNKGRAAAIQFLARGTAEPEAARKQITPVLESIAAAIGKSCGTEQQKK